MPSLPPVVDLFETHLNVSDLERSIAFYRDVVGLELATLIPERSIAFFWIGSPGRSMLGLWGTGTSPVYIRSHFAFRMAPADIVLAVDRLHAAGLTPKDLNGRGPVSEPVVIGWMPALSIYFDDPDGHSLEFISMLENEAPRPDLGVLPFSKWKQQTGQTQTKS